MTMNRWQGNSGRVQRISESRERPAARHTESMQMPPPQPRQQPGRGRAQGGLLSSLEGLKKLLPSKTEALETEDIILLLILYLMYRESGDTELLMVMGAMFLL